MRGTVLTRKAFKERKKRLKKDRNLVAATAHNSYLCAVHLLGVPPDPHNSDGSIGGIYDHGRNKPQPSLHGRKRWGETT
jgi:hypothetical protein